jgi:hypothetical protein
MEEMHVKPLKTVPEAFISLVCDYFYRATKKNNEGWWVKSFVVIVFLWCWG